MPPDPYTPLVEMFNDMAEGINNVGRAFGKMFAGFNFEPSNAVPTGKVMMMSTASEPAVTKAYIDEMHRHKPDRLTPLWKPAATEAEKLKYDVDFFIGHHTP